MDTETKENVVEDLLELCLNYVPEIKEKILERSEKYRQYVKQYHKSEKYKQYQKQYYKKNKEKILEKKRRQWQLRKQQQL